MRPRSLLVCLLVSTAAVQAQDHVRTLQHRYAFDADGVVKVVTYKGSITVEPWEKEEIQVDVRIEAEDLDGLLMLPHVSILMEGTTAQLHVETDYRRALLKLRELFEDAEAPALPPVHYTIHLPRRAGVVINDYMSDTFVRDFDADLAVFTYKGQVEIEDFGGALQLDTFEGRAKVAFSAFARTSTIASHQGDVTVALPADTAFDLDVDVRSTQGTFRPDSSYAGLRPDDDGLYAAKVNGGGPRLGLSTHRGELALSVVQ